MEDQANEPGFDAESIGTPVEPFPIKHRRPRINEKPGSSSGLSIDDPMRYRPNKCTPKAKAIGDPFTVIKIILDGDKHYFDREQHGDENGKRFGIERETVRDLAKESLRHLFLYSSTNEIFKFVNVAIKEGERAIRVVCKKEVNGCYLHIVIEVHPCDVIGAYEVTIKTALCGASFDVGDGQYLLEIFDEITSKLSMFQYDPRNKRGTFIKISQLG